jgi:serine/threonine protein kinase
VTPLPPPDELRIGEVIDGRYRVRRVLGRGGMGVVYEAEAIRLGQRACAIKVLAPEFTRNATAISRFSREAEVAARVKHPNVVEIFDTGTTGGGLGYIVMELLRGESLDRTLKRGGPLPWPRAQHIVLQICRALAAAHGERVIHRDIKPENCFRTRVDDDADFIKVLDFGIAKLTESEVGDDRGRLTASNSVIGTYSYMAYEQVCGEDIDHRIDIWATGVVLYELLTGRLPFVGNNQGQIWKAIATYDPIPLLDVAPHADIPRAAEAVVARALTRDRDRRYPTIEAFARALAGVAAKAGPTAVFIDTSSTLHRPERADEGTPVGALDLTQLGTANLRPATHENELAVASPSTHPGDASTIPPLREAMQTPLAALPPRRPTAARHLAVVAGAACILAVAWFAARSPDPPVATESIETPSPVAASVIPATPATPPPPTPPAPPEGPPAALQPPGSTATPPEPIVTAPPVARRTAKSGQPTPAKGKPADPEVSKLPKPQTFAEKAERELDRLRDGADVKTCFTTYQPDKPLKVDVQVSITGIAKLTVPPMKQNSGLALCLERSFRKFAFSRGKPGEVGLFRTDYVLNRQ